MNTGIITEIQHFSLHDGPGIRTTVFLKGCNLRCGWCHNPETQRAEPELQRFPERCIGCGACVAACARGNHQVVEGVRRFDRARCTACGACADACFAQGLLRVGRAVTAEAVLTDVLADRPFYEQSGGGMTLSGGEPLCQHAFAEALLRGGQAMGLHTAMETNLHAPWETMATLLPHLDLVMCDVKVLDDAVHRAWTGGSNTRILANLGHLAATELPCIVRTPVVPGVNDTPEAIRAIAAHIRAFPGLRYYELLPFHPLATGKYCSLAMENPTTGFVRPSDDTMQALASAAQGEGVVVRIAGRAVENKGLVHGH